MELPQDAGGAFFVFRNRSFPKAFRGDPCICRTADSGTRLLGPGVHRARTPGLALPGAWLVQGREPPLASHSGWPPPCQASLGRDCCSQVGLGTRPGAGERGSGVGDCVRTASLEVRGPGEQGSRWECGHMDTWCGRLHLPVCGCAGVSVQVGAGRGSTLTPSYEPPPPTGLREP